MIIQLLSYGMVSLSLADGLLLGAGQAALLCVAAVWTAFGQDRDSVPRVAEKNVPEVKPSKSKDVRARGKGDAGVLSALKSTFLPVWYGVAFLCFAFLATFPLQKGLSMLGVSSLVEAAVFTKLWEKALFCWLLPTVVADLLLRRTVLCRLEVLVQRRWLIVLLSGIFYGLFLPSVGEILARILLGALIGLLYLRRHSALSLFSVGLAVNGFLFLQEYVQTLGLAGAEAYTLAQTFGIGLTFAAPGGVILYFVEKRACQGKIKPLELLCRLVCVLFAFALGMALWLG